jgi:CheY-like chemotaxis protein
MKILLVDDEKDFLTLMQKRIESWGHVVEVASNSQEAMKLFKENIPDVIIVDYLMPDINGIDLLRKIREISRRTPAIILTAQPTIKAMEISKELGISAFIPKYSPYVDTQEDLKIALDLMRK